MRSSVFFLTLALALAAPSLALADGAVLSPSRLAPETRAELSAAIAQDRAARPGEHQAVTALRAELTRLDDEKRGRFPVIGGRLRALGPDALFALIDHAAFASPPRGDAADSAWTAWRAGLVEALSVLRDRRALPVYEAVLALDEPDPLVVRAAAEGLARLGDDPQVTALAALAHAPGPRRAPVLAALGACQRARAADVLSDELAIETDVETRTVILRALGSVGNAWTWRTGKVPRPAEEASARAIAAGALVAGFVRGGEAEQRAATKAILVVDSPSTPHFIAAARETASPDVRARLDELSRAFTRNPTRLSGMNMTTQTSWRRSALVRTALASSLAAAVACGGGDATDATAPASGGAGNGAAGASAGSAGNGGAAAGSGGTSTAGSGGTTAGGASGSSAGTGGGVGKGGASGGAGSAGTGGAAGATGGAAGAAGATGGAAGTSTAGPVNLRADVNRDGLVDAADDVDDGTWTAARGAVFLANIDDDQSACPKSGADEALAACNDAADDVVNGDADLEDLARLHVVAWPDAPDGATGTVSVDAKAVGSVRLFVGKGAAFGPLGAGALSTEQLRAGVELAIEARDIVRDAAAWDGYADVTLAVAGVGADKVRLRVSPLMMRHHLEAPERVYASSSTSAGNVAMRKDLAAAVAAAGVPKGLYEYPVSDQWNQDYFETAYMAMPGVGGGMKGIHVNIRSANYKTQLRAAGRIVFTLRGPDTAALVQYDPAHKDSWDTLNSFGNLETVPPYAFGGKSYPLGRVLRGNVPSFSPDPSFLLMQESQAVQPPIYLDTSWLLVGHVDETI